MGTRMYWCVHDQCFIGSWRQTLRLQQQLESLKMIKEEFVTTGKGGILIYLQQGPWYWTPQQDCCL